MQKAVANMSPKEKAAHFGRMVWTELPVIATIRGVLDVARMAHGTSLGGKVSLIHGPNGVGKSVACDHYFRSLANAEKGAFVGTDVRFQATDSILDAAWVTTTVGNRERRNFVKVDLSPRLTGNGLLSDMVRGLTLKDPPHAARHDKLLHAIKKILVGTGTEVLILDNAHRAVERNISVGSSEAGDIIAEIAKKTGVEVVLVGTDLATTLFTNSKELNLIKRQNQAVSILPMPVTNSTFLTLLSKFQERLPFGRRSDLTSDKVATRLYEFSGGNPQKLAVFLQSAVLLALTEKLEFIDLGTLADAYERFIGSTAVNPNPFMASRSSGTTRVEASEEPA